MSEDSSTSPVASSALGSFGTRPVRRNSITTGAPITSAASSRAVPDAAKNCNGRPSFTSIRMVRRMRSPSDQVRSLETDPAGRSR